MKITTVQGVGDIIWCLQLLSKKHSRIDVEVLCVADDPVQRRAEGFLKILPCVGDITYKVVPLEEYNRVAATKYAVPETDGEFAVNAWLEDGTRLDAIGDVDWSLRFSIPDIGVVASPYIAMYVSGNKADQTWDAPQWAHFVSKMYQRKNWSYPLYLFGAVFDRKALEDVAIALEKHNVQTHVVITSPEESVAILRDSEFFIGYQSGLNVIAAMYRTPQLMLWFPWLKKMHGTFVPPDALCIDAGFDEDIGEILERIR